MPQAFDEKELLERVGEDIPFLAETVQMLESDGRALMDQINSGLAASDAAAVGWAAHTLKGMISNFCAPGVQALAFDVERAGTAKDWTAGSAAAAKLGLALEALIAELAEFVKARS